MDIWTWSKANNFQVDQTNIFHSYESTFTFNSNVIGRLGLEGTLKIVSFQNSSRRQSFHSLDQVNQSLIQLGLEHLQASTVSLINLVSDIVILHKVILQHLHLRKKWF